MRHWIAVTCGGVTAFVVGALVIVALIDEDVTTYGRRERYLMLAGAVAVEFGYLAVALW